MKEMTIRMKITLWFIIVLTLIVALTYVAFFSISGTVLRGAAKDDLETILTGNLDEVHYHPGMEDFDAPAAAGQHLRYGEGYLSVDDDFLFLVGGVATGLYDAGGELMYGENLLPRETAGLPFVDGEIRQVQSAGDIFYVLDQILETEGAEALWLRSMVDRDQNLGEVSYVFQMTLIVLPLLILLAAAGGYVIARRSLAPIGRIAASAASIGRGQDLKQRIDAGADSRESKALEDSFNAMLQRLDESFESEKQFTSDVSHELRTPVSVILARCELSLGKQLTEAEARKALETIQRQGGKMNDLIQDMLTYTRLDRHLQQYDRRRLDLGDLVQGVCEELEETAARAENPLQRELAEDVYVEGSAQLLPRLTANLIANAIQYSSAGAPVSVRVYTEGSEAVLAVADQGIGIAPEDQEKIFDRFYRADPARSTGGTGLGLAMVRQIADLHGGRVLVESAPGRGSTFYFKMQRDQGR